MLLRKVQHQPLLKLSQHRHFYYYRSASYRSVLLNHRQKSSSHQSLLSSSSLSSFSLLPTLLSKNLEHQCNFRSSTFRHKINHFNNLSSNQSRNFNCQHHQISIKSDFLPTFQKNHSHQFTTKSSSESNDDRKNEIEGNDKLLQDLRFEVFGGSSYDDPSRYVSINGDGQELAEIFVQRNVLHGAKILLEGNNDGAGHVHQDSPSLEETCSPFLQIALEAAGRNGDQPQALASLPGLCRWVESCLVVSAEGSDDVVSDDDAVDEEGDINNRLVPPRSTTLDALRESGEDDDLVSLAAVRAIATGVPRPGHSVVGFGTYRDARKAWTDLAMEYARKTTLGEAALYKSAGAVVTGIEHLDLGAIDQSQLKESGGAIARFFFL